MKKAKFTSLLVIVGLLLQLLTAYAFAAEEFSNNMITLKVQCADSSVNLTEIAVDVYSAQLAYSDPSNGYYQYEETYELTRHLNSDGILVFTRPSEACSITIQLDSLPENYGVTEHTHFFLANSNTYTIILEPINEVDVAEECGQIIPVFTGESGSIIYTDATVTKNSESTYIIQDSAINILSSYLVVYGNLSQTIPYESSYTFWNEAEKATILYKNALISESAYIETIANWFLENKNNNTQNNEYALILQKYINDNPDYALTENIQRAYNTVLENQTALTSTSTEDYVYSASGRFRVYYPSDDLLEAAETIAARYDAIDAWLCTELGFKRPECAIDSNDSSAIRYTHYRIIIKDYQSDDDPYNDGNAATTPLSDVYEGMSHITLSTKTAQNIIEANKASSSNWQKGVYGHLAHEYMHAIMYAYGIPYDTTAQQWMHEAFATMTGILDETNALQYHKNAATTYLDDTHISMLSTEDPYGGFLFPLYIYEECGGMDAIKSILAAYEATSDPYAAIITGLQGGASTQTFATAFPRFAAFNSDTENYYDLIKEYYRNSTSTENFPNSYIYSTYSSYPASSVPRSIAPLAYYTLKYVPNNSTSSTLTITAEYNVSSTFGSGLYSVLTNSIGMKTMQHHSVGTTGRGTIVQYGFSTSNYESLLVIPSNFDAEANITLTVSASLQ